jgi:hypothetical protein
VLGQPGLFSNSSSSSSNNNRSSNSSSSNIFSKEKNFNNGRKLMECSILTPNNHLFHFNFFFLLILSSGKSISMRGNSVPLATFFSLLFLLWGCKPLQLDKILKAVYIVESFSFSFNNGKQFCWVY